MRAPCNIYASSQHTRKTLIFVYSRNLQCVCHRGSSVCQYRRLCRNIKLDLFETTMSFPTPDQKYLDKLPTQSMEVIKCKEFAVLFKLYFYL